MLDAHHNSTWGQRMYRDDQNPPPGLYRPYGYPDYPARPAGLAPITTGPQPQWPTPPTVLPPLPRPKSRWGIIAVLGISMLIMIFTAGGIGLLTNGGGQAFYSGSRVTPSADDYIVFATDEDLSGTSGPVSCTATTDAGQRVTVRPLPAPETATRGARPATKYRSIVEVPTNQGPLTVHCPGLDGARLLLTKPDSYVGVVLFGMGYAFLLAAVFTVVLVMRHNYAKRQRQLGVGVAPHRGWPMSAPIPGPSPSRPRIDYL